jgi:hypothetical protein
MSDWKECRLGDLIEEIAMGPFGSNIKVECFVDKGVPVLNGSNLQGFRLNEATFNYVTPEKADSLGRANAFKGDVVITHRGTLGQIIYIPEDSKYERYVISQSQFRVRFKKEIDPQFIVYFFHTRVGQHLLLTNASQVGVPAIARPSTSFKELKATVPPFAEQKKIASILSSLDEKIETNRKINARLEELAQALFKSWFIDFEPFGGEMPDNWQTGALSNIAQIIMGQSPSGESINNQQEGMIFYQGKSEFGERFPSVKNYTSNITRIAPQNSILLSVRAPVGDVNITLNQCCIGRGIASINYKDGSNSYLYLLLKSKSDYFDIFDNGGTVFGSINKKGLEEMPIIIPSSPTIKEFNEIISPIDKEIERRYNESTRLASLRDTLLPKLMSGELIPE